MAQNNAPPPRHPFEQRFHSANDRPRFVGLALKEAEDLARDEGLVLRVLELPVPAVVVWRDDLRADRLNLVVEDGRVMQAAVF